MQVMLKLTEQKLLLHKISTVAINSSASNCEC